MKNLINYYYNLIIKEFRKIEDYYIFDIDNKKYCFVPFYGNLNKLYQIYLLLRKNNKYCHEIIINKDKSIITFYDNIPYILLKKNVNLTNLVTLEEIFSYDIIVYEKLELNWKELWEEKIDYYEYQMNQLGFKYKILKESFSYYVGLSESAISLLNYINKKNIKFSICHKRVNYKENMDDFLNPLNIIVDNRTRDIAEFFKVNYINNNIDVEKVLNYLNILDLDYNESLLLMARLMYPSYYFDVYDKVIQEKISEEKVNFYIKKNVYYETFLNKIYVYLKGRYKIPEVEWLETKIY